MTKKYMRWSLLLLALIVGLFIWLALPPSALAQADDCPVDLCIAWPEALSKMFAVALQNAKLDLMKAIASTVWLIDRMVLTLFDLLVQGDLWLRLQEGILSSLEAFMPGVLQDLIGGADGLLYIALMIAGVMMTIPFANTRLVNPGQAILWAAIVLTLFVGGSAGYDLIGAVEGLRTDIMERIIGAGGDADDVHVIVTGPMQASNGDLGFEPLFALPEDFESEYFLPPQQYITVRTVFVELPLTHAGVADFQMETEASLQSRRDRAIPGVVLALLSLVGAYSACIFALVFALLMTASLGLIIFLFAALPMGLFEFGRTVVAGIFNKYLQIVTLSIGVAIFTGIVSYVLNTIPTTANTVSDALEYVALLMPVIGIQHMFLGWAWQAMMSSREIFSRTMSAVFATGGLRPGLLRQGVATTMRTMGMVAPLALPGVSGIAAGVASNILAGRLLPDAPAPPRGDVFAEMQKNFGGGV